MKLDEKTMEMLRREVIQTQGTSREQSERWLIIKRQFKMSEQLNRIEAKLDSLSLKIKNSL